MSQIVETLQENGIKARDYKRGPLGNRQFGISILNDNPEGTIMFWQGGADVEVHPDKDYRQAVLSVKEDAHQIKQTVKVNWGRLNLLTSNEDMRAFGLREFNIVVPRRTKFKMKSNLKQAKSGTNTYASGTIDITAHVPSFKQDLLIGFDERYHFISELPRKAKSVEEAHRILRPTKIPAETVRMGEWFFAPVSDKTQIILDNRALNPVNVLSRQLEPGSSHSGRQVTRYRNNLYVVGYVFDSRTSHHEPLYFEQWHKAVRNREITISPRRRMETARRRYWD